ncbi:hypothetical protein P3S68_017016 [Capsicum galapagoense]
MVPPTEILKKASLITDASTSHPTKKQKKIVRFDSTTAEDVHVLDGSTVRDKSTQAQVDEMDIMQNIEGIKKGLNAIVGETDKSTDIHSADDQIDGHYFDWNRRCSEDNATVSLDALVEFVINHNSDNTNDVEGISTDIGPVTLKCLITAVENQKPENDNVGTSTMQVDYLSTLPESAQVELDVILKVIAAPVDDVPIEVLPLDFPDVVVAAHQAAKTPAKIAKRIRTRSKVFKSPYIIEYAFGSKAIEDQIEEQKQQFAFDGFLISDTMSSSVIEEFKQ